MVRWCEDDGYALHVVERLDEWLWDVFSGVMVFVGDVLLCWFYSVKLMTVSITTIQYVLLPNKPFNIYYPCKLLVIAATMLVVYMDQMVVIIPKNQQVCINYFNIQNMTKYSCPNPFLTIA